ncbi:MAG TPA: monovalent cation/H+ antiporter complex subunit F [Solirubrobacteraceae bacterium]|jgi:multisubunit Na+/H+ antiporter MnhF subunit
MNEWEIAAAVLTVAILPCVGVCVFCTAGSALAALEVSSVLATTALIALAEGFHRQPFIDLALILAVLSVVGSLAFARLMEGDI